MVGSVETQGAESIGWVAGADGAAGLSAASAKCADSGRDDRFGGMVGGVGGVMPTVISKRGAERVRRRAVPRTSPMREAMSPGR